jgi:hypothetical protein
MFLTTSSTYRGLRARFLFALAAGVVLTACDNTELLDPETSGAPNEVAAAPVEVETAAARQAGGIPIGMSAQPVSAFGDVYSGAKLTVSPGDIMSKLSAVRSRGGRVVLMLAGHPRYYKDSRGHFSLTKWKDLVGRFRHLNLASYIKDGTLAGHYMIDEPNDPFNWTNEPVPGPMLDEMAAYSKQLWPKMATVVRVEPGYLAQWSGYRYLDAAWAQWVSRKGDPAVYIREQVALAQKLGLKLITGLNISKGAPNQSPMPASMVQSAGSALLANDYPCAFISWEYDAQYLSRSDIKTVMSQLSQKAAGHSARSCSKAAGDAPPPPSLPSTSGIALTAAKVVKDDEQIVSLTWKGAAGSEVKLYVNSAYRRTTVNDGKAFVYPQRAGTYGYKVCDADQKCSNTASVTIQ